MNKEMININGNLVKEVKVSEFQRENENIKVANFTIVKKYGKTKEYINCSAYGDKVIQTEEFKQGDYIHIFGYFRENIKEDKKYKNFVIKLCNKIEKNKEE